MLKTVTLSALLVSAFAFAPAYAASEKDCEDAVAQTQADMQDNAGAMMEKDSIQDEWDMQLERAAGYGMEGKYDECLQTVQAVRGEAGLEKL